MKSQRNFFESMQDISFMAKLSNITSRGSSSQLKCSKLSVVVFPWFRRKPIIKCDKFIF